FDCRMAQSRLVGYGRKAATLGGRTLFVLWFFDGASLERGCIARTCGRARRGDRRGNPRGVKNFDGRSVRRRYERGLSVSRAFARREIRRGHGGAREISRRSRAASKICCRL